MKSKVIELSLNETELQTSKFRKCFLNYIYYCRIYMCVCDVVVVVIAVLVVGYLISYICNKLLCIIYYLVFSSMDIT